MQVGSKADISQNQNSMSSWATPCVTESQISWRGFRFATTRVPFVPQVPVGNLTRYHIKISESAPLLEDLNSLR